MSLEPLNKMVSMEIFSMALEKMLLEDAKKTKEILKYYNIGFTGVICESLTNIRMARN